MKTVKLISFVAFLLLLAALMAACGGGQTVEPTAVPVEATTPVDTGGDAAPTDATVVQEPPPADETAPEDVPIMDGIRDLQITNKGMNVSYVVDGEITDVVSFYQEKLASVGWEMARAPDNAVGSIATMSRVNAAGDRISLTLQHNPIGNFTVVQIVVLRAP